MAKTVKEEDLGILEKMLKLLKKYGAWSIAKALMFITMFFLVLWTVTHIDKIFEEVILKQNKEKTEHHELVMKHRTEIKPKIELILKDALENMDADRAFVIEMHNGTNSLTGLPFVYCEITYERCRKGIDRVDDEYGSVVLSRYQLPYYMSKNQLFCGTIEEVEEIDPKLAHRMKDNGTSYLCVANMYSLDEYIGYVGISYIDGTEPASKEALENEIFKLSQRISTLLEVQNIE